MLESKLTKHQKRTFRADYYDERNDPCTLIATVRFDDECGNGHNSFAITADLYDRDERNGEPGTKHRESGKKLWLGSCGCLHDEIEKHLPELAEYVKWHGCSTDEPMHYVANTVYHASSTNYDGLKKGEYSAFVKAVMVEAKADGGTVEVFRTETMYSNKLSNANLTKSNDKEEKRLKDFIRDIKPSLKPTVKAINCEWSKSEGKEADLEAARSTAIWPDATLKQLANKGLLAKRLPALMTDFKKAVEKLGFTY